MALNRKILMPNDEELISYSELVNEKATQNSSDILPNAGEFHAAVAMSKLLEKTEHVVRMVVGSFNPNVCDQENYLTSLKKCIDKNIEFNILFLNSLNKESKAYKLLTANKHRPIKIKQASDEFRKKLTINGVQKHFAVFDSNKFRFEKDSTNYLAWFCFNNETISKTLINSFDLEFSRA